MAKNVKLTWTNPASVDDIDTIEVYRKTGDHTAVTDMDAFRSGLRLQHLLLSALLVLLKSTQKMMLLRKHTPTELSQRMLVVLAQEI